ncbi:MAG: transposase [Marmoricola sp.]
MDDIEDFITTGLTNAKTEAANTPIKQIKRTGRGYRNDHHYFQILSHLAWGLRMKDEEEFDRDQIPRRVRVARLKGCGLSLQTSVVGSLNKPSIASKAASSSSPDATRE